MLSQRDYYKVETKSVSWFFIDLTIILIEVDTGGKQVLRNKDCSDKSYGNHDCLLSDWKQQGKTYAIIYYLPMKAFLKSQKILIFMPVFEFQTCLYNFYINLFFLFMPKTLTIIDISSH